MKSSSIKLPLIGFATLVAVMAVATWIGRPFTLARWGDDGVRSMVVAGGICLAASVLAFVPMVLVTIFKPDYTGQGALAATVIRLLASMAGLGAYQVLSKPHMASFLAWAVIYYCLLLAVDTAFSVALVQRAFPKRQPQEAIPA